MLDKFKKELLNELGSKNVFFDDKKKSIYTSGWRMPPAKCEVVVTPTSLIKMWKTLKILNKFDKVIIMQASNTSLTGGSTPNGSYSRKVAIVNTLKLDKILLINNAEQVIAFPGSTLYGLEKKLINKDRAPHSEIGSSCIGASIVGGICNNSGGSLIKRGPAYTELSLFAQIDAMGNLSLVNKLGVNLGDTPEEILSKLDNEKINENDIIFSNSKASSTDYKEILKDVNSATPARYNADKRRLFDASGCAGKLAVFAVRLDTFAKEKEEKVFFYSTNSSEDLTIFRKRVLTEIEDLPIYGEYVHRDAYEVSKKYGKDLFLLIHFLGTSSMPFFYKLKTRLENYFARSRLFSSKTLDHLLNLVVKIFPNHLPKKFDKLNEKYEHHLILKCDEKIYKEILQVSREIFSRNNNNFFECNKLESKKIILNRYVFAGATLRYANLDPESNSELLALDFAHKRNEKEWEEKLPAEISKYIHKSLCVAHFFCNVFHREYLVKKGAKNSLVKKKLLKRLDHLGAKYPAEHNVGHVYEAEKDLADFYNKLDPTNSFNPGIGKTSKEYISRK